MFDLMAPDLTLGALALATAVLYAAWHEYRAQNHRDAKLLAAIGAVSMVGGAVVWIS